jgi:hypothetical protein
MTHAKMNKVWTTAFTNIASKVVGFNKAGVFYPMWISGTSVVAWFNGANFEEANLKNYASGLVFQKENNMDKLKFPESSVYFNIDRAMTPESISHHSDAHKWIIDATSTDRSGQEVVAVLHHPEYPIYCSLA